MQFTPELLKRISNGKSLKAVYIYRLLGDPFEPLASVVQTGYCRELLRASKSVPSTD